MESADTVDCARLRRRLADLAARNVFVGTSSWKYPGWRGMLYDEARYVWRGKFSEARFEKLCLAEYAGVFKTVCVDAAYYKFPDRRFIDGLVSQVPADFQFGFKVTDEITVRRFSNLPRFGLRAGKANPNFLNADLFVSAFLEPLGPFRSNVGLLMFEFSRFYPSDFGHGREFVEALDGFLAKLPRGWRYGVEIRNQHFLRAEYFSALARHGVAHVYNSWQDMPPVGEQLAMAGSRTNADFTAARFLLKPGRKYEEAVRLFSPYNRVKEPDHTGRAAGSQLIREGITGGAPDGVFIYVNNRFEGNALATIEAMLDGASIEQPDS